MIGLVVLNFKTYDSTEFLLKSLEASQVDNDFLIFIVDNESSDSELPKFRKSFANSKNIKIISSPDNKGFARGMNLGIYAAREAGCDYIICSNSDIRIPDFQDVLRLIKHSDKNPDIGVIAPQILGRNGRAQNPLRQFPLRNIKLASFFINIPYLGFFIFALRFLIRAFIGREKSPPLLSSGNYYCPHGAFFILTPSYLDLYQGLDEGTFLYCEELIIAARLRQSDLRFYLDSSTYVEHLEDLATDRLLKGKVLAKVLFQLKHNYLSLKYYLGKYEK